METKLLINKATISAYEDIAVNITEDRMSVVIRKAQELDLKPFLGSAFYYDLLKKVVLDADLQPIDPTPQPYIDLINGADYTDSYGHELTFNGMREALVYWSFARFNEMDAVRQTATGPVYKIHDNADPVKGGDLAKYVASQRSIANAYANDIIAFLEAKKADYPLYRYNERNANSRQPGARLRSIDKTNYNNPGYPSNRGFLSGLI